MEDMEPRMESTYVRNKRSRTLNPLQFGHSLNLKPESRMEEEPTMWDEMRTEVECTVLEVKVIEGLGTTIDVVLVNGILHKGDQIVICGMQIPLYQRIQAHSQEKSSSDKLLLLRRKQKSFLLSR